MGSGVLVGGWVVGYNYYARLLVSVCVCMCVCVCGVSVCVVRVTTVPCKRLFVRFAVL